MRRSAESKDRGPGFEAAVGVWDLRGVGVGAASPRVDRDRRRWRRGVEEKDAAKGRVRGPDQIAQRVVRVDPRVDGRARLRGDVVVLPHEGLEFQALVGPAVRRDDRIPQEPPRELAEVVLGTARRRRVVELTRAQ